MLDMIDDELRGLQGECPTGTTSKPVVREPQGNAGESPARSISSNERISDERLRNTRAWAAARLGQMSGAEVIVGAIDELLNLRIEALEAQGAIEHEQIQNQRLRADNDMLAHELAKTSKANQVAQAALVAVRAKLAEYLERILQGRTLPNRWVGEINDIVGAALSGDSPSVVETKAPPPDVVVGYATCSSGGGFPPTVTVGFQSLSHAQAFHAWLIGAKPPAQETTHE